MQSSAELFDRTLVYSSSRSTELNLASTSVAVRTTNCSMPVSCKSQPHDKRLLMKISLLELLSVFFEKAQCNIIVAQNVPE